MEKIDRLKIIKARGLFSTNRLDCVLRLWRREARGESYEHVDHMELALH